MNPRETGCVPQPVEVTGKRGGEQNLRRSIACNLVPNPAVRPFVNRTGGLPIMRSPVQPIWKTPSPPTLASENLWVTITYMPGLAKDSSTNPPCAGKRSSACEPPCSAFPGRNRYAPSL